MAVTFFRLTKSVNRQIRIACLFLPPSSAVDAGDLTWERPNVRQKTRHIR